MVKYTVDFARQHYLTAVGRIARSGSLQAFSDNLLRLFFDTTAAIFSKLAGMS